MGEGWLVGQAGCTQEIPSNSLRSRDLLWADRSHPEGPAHASTWQKGILRHRESGPGVTQLVTGATAGPPPWLRHFSRDRVDKALTVSQGTAKGTH